MAWFKHHAKQPLLCQSLKLEHKQGSMCIVLVVLTTITGFPAVARAYVKRMVQVMIWVQMHGLGSQVHVQMS